MRQLFIVFEGIDGDGKSTQAKMLREWLESRGMDVFQTSEPSKSEYGKQIEELLRKKDAANVSKEKWVELFTLDSIENLKDIKDALQSGKTVICDRYYYSTLAYQLEESEWQEHASKFLAPDITFILDVPAETGIERTKEKYEETGEKKAYFEKLEILKKVRKKFLILPRYLKDNIKIIDSARAIDVIFEDIKKEIEILID